MYSYRLNVKRNQTNQKLSYMYVCGGTSILCSLAKLYNFFCIIELILFLPTIFNILPPLIPDISNSRNI